MKTYTKLVKNKTELESKSKEIIELDTKIASLKKEVVILKNKNSILLSDENIFAFEKKKYLVSVQSTLEKAIRFEKLNPNLKIDSHSQMIRELSRITEKVAKKNNIPDSAFVEIFKDSKKVAYFFTLLRFGERKSTQSENNDLEKQKKTNSLKINNQPEQQKEEPEKRRGFKR